MMDSRFRGNDRESEMEGMDSRFRGNDREGAGITRGESGKRRRGNWETEGMDSRFRGNDKKRECDI